MSFSLSRSLFLRSRVLFFTIALSVSSLGACETKNHLPGADGGADTSVLDASISDAGTDASPDASSDSSLADAFSDADHDSAVDGGIACGSSVCTSNQICLREVCIASCGLVQAEAEAALGAGVRPVGHVCRGDQTLFGVRSIAAGGLRIYEVAVSGTGSSRTFAVSRFRFESGTTPTLESLGSTTANDLPGTMLYAGNYLSVSPDESRILFGFTTNGAGFAGGLFEFNAVGMTGSFVTANANYDAIFVGNDLYYVNGFSVDSNTNEQGLYGVKLSPNRTSWTAVDDLGTSSGSVAFDEGRDLIWTGGSDYSPEVPVVAIFAIPASRIDSAANEPVHAMEQAGRNGIKRFDIGSSDFRLIGGSHLLLSDYTGEKFDIRPITGNGASLAIGEASAFARFSIFNQAIPASGNQVVLRHSAGYLLVEVQ